MPLLSKCGKIYDLQHLFYKTFSGRNVSQIFINFIQGIKKLSFDIHFKGNPAAVPSGFMFF
jgi:hypothetical protein